MVLGQQVFDLKRKKNRKLHFLEFAPNIFIKHTNETYQLIIENYLYLVIFCLILIYLEDYRLFNTMSNLIFTLRQKQNGLHILNYAYHFNK